MFLIVNNTFYNVDYIRRLFIYSQEDQIVVKDPIGPLLRVESCSDTHLLPYLHIEFTDDINGFTDSGSVDVLLQYIRDITDSKTQRQKIKELRQWLSQTLNSGSNLGNVQLNIMTGYMGVPYAEEDNE